MIKRFIALLRKDIHDLEYEAKAQYRYHRGAAVFWLGTMIVIPFLPWLYDGAVGILIILEVSLYANFGTEFGAMSAAEAAIGMSPQQTTVSLSPLAGVVEPIIEPVKPDSPTATF